MLRPIASMSALVARSQASRTTPLWISRRASVRSPNEMAPRCIRSWMTRVMLVGSPGRTKAPPLTPFLSSTMPAISRLRRASRRALRLTPSCTARSRSAGSLSPGRRARIESWWRIRSQTSSKARRRRIGSNIRGCWILVDGRANAGLTKCWSVDLSSAERHCQRAILALVRPKALSAQTPQIAAIAAALGGRHAGSFAGVAAHGPRQCVIEGAAAARAADADLLVAVGGGSVVDAAKVMQLCLRHGITETAALSGHSGRGRADPSTRPSDADRWLRVIAVPTTLSAAEFTWFGGASDPARGVKESFSHPMMIPQAIVMDPQMTLATPTRLLLTTGMKAVDHAAERLASLKSNPYND